MPRKKKQMLRKKNQLQAKVFKNTSYQSEESIFSII